MADGKERNLKKEIDEKLHDGIMRDALSPLLLDPNNSGRRGCMGL